MKPGVCNSLGADLYLSVLGPIFGGLLNEHAREYYRMEALN